MTIQQEQDARKEEHILEPHSRGVPEAALMLGGGKQPASMAWGLKATKFCFYYTLLHPNIDDLDIFLPNIIEKNTSNSTAYI